MCQRLAVLVPILLAFTPALRAQTLELQTKVEAKLWTQRWLYWLGSPDGLRTITVFVSIAIVLLMLAIWWLWTRNRGG
jgi:hypothetical protein